MPNIFFIFYLLIGVSVFILEMYSLIEEYMSPRKPQSVIMKMRKSTLPGAIGIFILSTMTGKLLAVLAWFIPYAYFNFRK